MLATLRAAAVAPAILRVTPMRIGSKVVPRVVTTVARPVTRAVPVAMPVVARSSGGQAQPSRPGKGNKQQKVAKKKGATYDAAAARRHEEEFLKDLFLVQVVGITPKELATRFRNYRKYALEAIIERFLMCWACNPALLTGRDGRPSLSWIANNRWFRERSGMTKRRYRLLADGIMLAPNTQQLLDELREGKTDNWP